MVQVGRTGRLVPGAQAVAVDKLALQEELVDIVGSVVEVVNIVAGVVQQFEVVDRLVAAVEAQGQSLGFVQGHKILEDIPPWEGNNDTPGSPVESDLEGRDMKMVSSVSVVLAVWRQPLCFESLQHHSTANTVPVQS